MGCILKEKLKLLKGELKRWNKETFGEVDAKIQLLVEEISAADLKGEAVGLSLDEQLHRKENFATLWGLLRSKESILFQRSRSKWLKEGDANSTYFHACVKGRSSRNRISALRVSGVWVEDVAGIRGAVSEYFSNHFSEEVWNQPILDGIAFPSLSPSHISGLSGPFSLEEIEQVVWSCDGKKSPGPDGFNFAFLKAFWPLIKVEVGVLFEELFRNGTLPMSFSSYFLALIPKVASPFGLGDFRPISLLGCLYKMLAMVLVTRLEKVMDSFDLGFPVCFY